MDTPVNRSNRVLQVFMIALYLLSLAGFSYANWVLDPEPVWWMLLANTLILSLPLILFYGSLYVLIRAWIEHHISGEITPALAKTIHWTPRIAAIGIIFFVSLFSLDVFEMDASPLQLLGGFIIHNIPSIVMIVLLIFAWKRPMVGFFAFLLAGLFFLRFVIFNLSLGHFLLFSGPLLLISTLFYADWRWIQPGSPKPLDAAA
jgi:hypothetical protein